MWSNYKNIQLARAYEQGAADGIGDIIHQLMQEAEKCQPFQVSSGEKQTELIKTDCFDLTP